MGTAQTHSSLQGRRRPSGSGRRSCCRVSPGRRGPGSCPTSPPPCSCTTHTATRRRRSCANGCRERESSQTSCRTCRKDNARPHRGPAVRCARRETSTSSCRTASLDRRAPGLCLSIRLACSRTTRTASCRHRRSGRARQAKLCYQTADRTSRTDTCRPRCAEAAPSHQRDSGSHTRRTACAARRDRETCQRSGRRYSCTSCIATCRHRSCAHARREQKRSQRCARTCRTGICRGYPSRVGRYAPPASETSTSNREYPFRPDRGSCPYTRRPCMRTSRTASCRRRIASGASQAPCACRSPCRTCRTRTCPSRPAWEGRRAPNAIGRRTPSTASAHLPVQAPCRLSPHTCSRTNCSATRRHRRSGGGRRARRASGTLGRTCRRPPRLFRWS